MQIRQEIAASSLWQKKSGGGENDPSHRKKVNLSIFGEKEKEKRKVKKSASGCQKKLGF